MFSPHVALLFFFFNDTATTEIYTLSLHDALPIFVVFAGPVERVAAGGDQPAELAQQRRHDGLATYAETAELFHPRFDRSEEHTSELQSRQYLVCRLLLEKKKKILIASHSHSYL